MKAGERTRDGGMAKTTGDSAEFAEMLIARSFQISKMIEIAAALELVD